MNTLAPVAAILRSAATSVAARILLTLPFWWSGLSKLANLDAAFGEAAHFGLQPAWLTVASTILVQVGGSALIIAGRLSWLGAGALGVFTAIATLIAHPFWTVADPVARFHETNTFLEHVGLIGAFVLAAILAERERA